MAIKVSLGRLTLSVPFDYLIPEQLTQNGIESLNIKIDHVSLLATLPFHHRDPFDRMIIAQAISEEMPVVSIDAALDEYEIKRLW